MECYARKQTELLESKNIFDRVLQHFKNKYHYKMAWIVSKGRLMKTLGPFVTLMREWQPMEVLADALGGGLRTFFTGRPF